MSDKRDGLLVQLKQRCKQVAPGVSPAVEGLGSAASENTDWLLVDCGSVVAHVFEGAARKEYNLESLWAGKAVDENALLAA